MRFIIHGDFHGYFENLYALQELHNPETAIICLGDTGINYFLNDIDESKKEKLNSLGCYLYLVRGNHEMRPEHLKNIQDLNDNNVNGIVMYEPQFPNIRYFKDGGEYIINGKKTLVIGGAYSVDKWYRLANDYTWFEDEQLTTLERHIISAHTKGKTYNVLLSHTCPFRFQPTFLFLGTVNQDNIDNSMELWLDRIWNNANIKEIYFGHYHGDYELGDGIHLCYEGWYDWN